MTLSPLVDAALRVAAIVDVHQSLRVDPSTSETFADALADYRAARDRALDEVGVVK